MGNAACVVPAGEGRSIFALPWYGRTLIGTTDVDYSGSLDAIGAPVDDIEYLLGTINEFFGISLSDSDLVGAYAGVRPLISTGDPRKSVDISRRAELFETSSGMLTITGGKLTTWRRMAQQTVDRIVERAGRDAPCVTAEIPLGMELDPATVEAPAGVDREAVDQLAFRYGHAALQVLDLAAEDPELAAPVVPGRPDLMAEVVIACRQEQARSISDVLLRRTRLGITAASSLSGREAVEPLSRVMAAELGWDESRRLAEVDEWLETVVAEGLDPGRRTASA
jgi:glycerol-3-phosphate dehydrogenase